MNRMKGTCLAVIGCILIMLTALPLFAANTYYVSQSGDDGNLGTSTSPWKSIDFADSNGKLQAGDTVIVTQGTYTVNTTDDAVGVLLSQCSGTSTQPINYIAQGNVIVDGGPAAFQWQRTIDIRANYVILDGFHVKGSYLMLYVDGATGVEVKNSQFSDGGGGSFSAVEFRNTTSGNFHHNIVGPNLAYPTTGIYETGSHSGDKFNNNTIVGTSNQALLIEGAGATEFKNNIIYNGAGGMWTQRNDLLSHTNNIIFACARPYDNTWWSNAAPGANEITTDPVLVAPDSGNFNLVSGSPAIDAGINLGFAYQGSAPDIGALESVSVPTSGGTVTGTVSDSELGVPVASARVTININGKPFTVQTDASGQYTVKALAGANQTIMAFKHLYSTDTKTVTVSQGVTSTVNFGVSEIIQPKTYYVKPGGDDTKSGLTEADAWKTINYGDVRATLVRGDTVIVLPGTYNVTRDGVIGLTFAVCSGTPAHPITYKAQGDVIIETAVPDWDWERTLDIHCNYTIFDGFHLKGSDMLIYANGCKGIEIKNCRMTDAGRDGYQWPAVWLESMTDLKFHNNVIGPNLLNSKGIYEKDSLTPAKFYNNIIIGTTPHAIQAEGTVATEFKNNIIYTGDGGIWTSNTAFDHTNNIIFGCIRPYDQYWYGGIAVPGAGELTDDPILADPANGIFIPVAGSPAVDTGIDVGLTYVGSAPDMGAFELPGIPTNGGTISGTVTEQGTGDLIPGAIVGVSIDGQPYYTTTNLQGTYTVVASAGSQTVTARANGYASAVPQMTTLSAGGTAIVNFVLTPTMLRTDKLGEVLSQPNGTWVKLQECVVTVGTGAFSTGALYVEDKSRASGVRLSVPDGLITVAEGDKLRVFGTIDTVDGERVLKASSVTSLGSGSPLTALGMSGKSIPQSGLLVKIWGKITYKNYTETYFCLDDGSGASDGKGHAGIPVWVADSSESIWPLPDENTFVAVTGVLSVQDFGGGVVSVLRVRKTVDIQPQ